MKKFFYLGLILLGSSLITRAQYNISGKVLDETGKPLPGANVYIPEFEMGTISTPEGTFEIKDIPASRFILQISFMGYRTYLEPIETGDQSKELEIRLVPSVMTAKEVVLSGGRHASQHDNAIKIELVKTREMSRLGDPTLIEQITYLPGVDMISRGGSVVTPVIRGLSTSNILVLNNGIRMENYQFSENHPYLLSEGGLEQVEVIKGPASLLYGSDAMGGVINLVHDHTAPNQSLQGEGRLKYHSNTQGNRAGFGLQGTHDLFSWGLRGGTGSHQDYISGKDRTVPNTRFNHRDIKTYLGYRTAKTTHRLNYEYQKLKPGLANEASVLLVEDNERVNRYWYQDLDNHLLGLNNAWFSDPFKVRLNLAYQHNVRQLVTQSKEDPAVHMTLRTFSYEGRVNYVFSSFSEFILAVQGLTQKNRNFEAPNRVLPDYTMNDLGVFGMLQHDFSEDLHFQFGIRFDNRFIRVPEQERSGHSHEEEPGHEEGDHQEELLPSLNTYYGNLSGSLGATYEVIEGLLIRGNLASAYRSPSLAELTQDGEHGVRYEQGNRNLVPQRNYELDASIHFHRKRIMFDLAGYLNYIDQYIFLDYTADTTAEGLDIYRYQQEDAMIHGFETILEVVPLNWMNLKGSYNYIRGRRTGDGGNLPFIPQNKFRAELKVHSDKLLQKSKIFLKLAGEFVQDQDHPSRFETKTGNYALMHAGIGMDLSLRSQHVELDVNLRNIFNTAYIDHLSTLKPLGYHNMGRNVVVVLRVPFTTELSR